MSREKVVIGIDEAGMGTLAGPVTAAVVVFSEDCKIFGVRDSKKLTENQRENLVDDIYKNSLFYKISLRDSQDIDSKGISSCWVSLITELAVEAHKKFPEVDIILDGNRLINGLPYIHPIVKADDKILCVSAASILSKYMQCCVMDDYHDLYPMYGFDQHRGYSTSKHLEALKEYGPCPIHRKTFRPVKKQIRFTISG